MERMLDDTERFDPDFLNDDFCDDADSPAGEAKSEFIWCEKGHLLEYGDDLSMTVKIITDFHGGAQVK